MKEPALNRDRLRDLSDDWARQCGKRIRNHRVALDWSQEDLADLVGIRPQSVSKFELGTAIPKESVRMALANALLCEVADLFPPVPRAIIASHAGRAA